jgi:hypothetical protein
VTRLASAALVSFAALVLAPAASADRAQEQALAERYAPVVRLVSHTDCAPGKPYLPIDVNLLFDEPTVALRGPWSPGDLSRSARPRKTSRRVCSSTTSLPGERAPAGL